MKLFTRIIQSIVLGTKSKKQVPAIGAEIQIAANGINPPAGFNALESPLEKVSPVLMPRYVIDPTALDKAIQQGEVSGSIEELKVVSHRIMLRDPAFFAKHKKAREECHNEEITREEECHNVDEANALDADEQGWFKVSPYGIYPGKIPGRLQHFGEPEAKAMEAHFNSIAGRLGRLFRGIPIFIGHPDVDRTLWPDERRLGKVSAVRARADGLWARGEWNALGADNKENGYWVYPSPRWDGPPNQSEFRPDRLLSIGLTNMPRITTSEPIANALSGKENSQQNTNNMDRKLLIEKLGLAAEATDEDITAKLDALLKENADMAAAEKAKLDAESEKQGSGGTDQGSGGTGQESDEDELKKARMETANARVDLAIAEGRIALAERDAWLGRLSGDNRESEANALGALKPKLNTGALDLQKARTDIGDEVQRRETIHNAVAAEQAKGKSYKDAYNAVRSNPEFKAVFEAMKEPGREEA